MHYTRAELDQMTRDITTAFQCPDCLSTIIFDFPGTMPNRVIVEHSVGCYWLADAVQDVTVVEHRFIR